MGSSYKAPPALKRSHYIASRRKKLDIILYLMHHRIEEPEVRQRFKQKRRCLEGLEWDDCRRPPTAAETGAHFKVPARTVNNIWRDRHKIVDQSPTSRRDTSGAQQKRLKSPSQPGLASGELSCEDALIEDRRDDEASHELVTTGSEEGVAENEQRQLQKPT